MVLISSHAFAQNQDAVILAGGLLNLIKFPEEILFGITHPGKMKKYENLVSSTNQEADRKAEALTCEEKCPDNLHVLKEQRQKMLADRGENLLSFLNEKSDFANHIQRTVGYCWGHSTVTRTFNYLAHFDPEERFEKAPSRDNAKKFRAFYRKKIRKIMNMKAQIIPGFKNLREFSADAEIQDLLKNKVVWGWADKTLRARSVGVFSKGQKGLMAKVEIESFIKEVEGKLAVNHTPKIFFTNLKKPGFIHVVNVNEVVRNGNEVKICILDNHQYEEELKDCGVSVTVNFEKHEMHYHGWDNPERELEGFVGQLGFTPEDEVELLDYQKQNRKMCLKMCEATASEENSSLR